MLRSRLMTIAFHTVLLWLWMRRLSVDHSQQSDDYSLPYSAAMVMDEKAIF